MSTPNLNCLYYPFSRLLDSTTLKYLLLVFDSVTFLDEAEAPAWRKALLRQMIPTSKLFSSYDALSEDYDALSEAQAVHIISPKNLKARGSTQVALATIADLSDTKFVEMALNPDRFGLPSIPIGVSTATPSWQTFQGKIPNPLIQDQKFLGDERWASHILLPGDDFAAWTLSYAAGSSVATNFYLETAQELQLTPITDSQLHHQLVLRKLKRVFASNEDKIDFIDDFERKRFRAVFGYAEVINLLSELFPTNQLQGVSFKDIIKFRHETQELRQRFLREVSDVLRVIDSHPNSASYDKEVITSIQKLESDFKTIEKDLTTIRNKVLPAFAKATMFGTAGGGILSALVSFLGGLSPAGVVAASALTISGAFLAEAVELWNEKRKIQGNVSSSVSYLTKISKLVR